MTACRPRTAPARLQSDQRIICTMTRINGAPQIRVDILVHRSAEAAASRACVASIADTQMLASVCSLGTFSITS